MTVTTPLSPVEVEVKMAQCIEALEDAVNEQRECAHEYAAANHRYRQAFAQKMLAAREEKALTSDKMREAWAITEVKDEMWHRDLAEAQHESQKSVVRSLQTQAELLRSLARSSRDLVDSWHGGR